MVTGIYKQWTILKLASRYGHRTAVSIFTTSSRAVVLQSNHDQYASFMLQTMQARAAKEHQDVVTYSLMDVTALQMQV